LDEEAIIYSCIDKLSRKTNPDQTRVCRVAVRD